MAVNGMRKWVVLSGVVALVAIILVLVAVRGHAPAVPVAVISRSDLNAAVTSNGKVEPVAPAVFRAEFPAFVSKVLATEGQSVRRGQTILTLDAGDVRAALAQARAGLASAESDLRNAQAGGPPADLAQLKGDLEKARVQVENLKRTHQSLERLVAKQAATEDELAQNTAQLAQAESNFQTLQQKLDGMARQASADAEQAGLRASQAQEQVLTLQSKLRSSTVVAPIDGTLYSLPVRAGDYVQIGTLLAEVADLHHVRVRAFVDEPDLGWLEPDQEVQVTWDAKPGRVWTGHTELIPKQVVALGARSVGEVLCTAANDNLELIPNVNVEVKILVRQRQGVLVVPRAAVRYDAGQHYVFVLKDAKIYRRNISVGISSTADYEVLSGLSENDRVALPGVAELRNGMDVRPLEEN
jgi:HlyD family secretion protein